MWMLKIESGSSEKADKDSETLSTLYPTTYQNSILLGTKLTRHQAIGIPTSLLSHCQITSVTQSPAETRSHCLSQPCLKFAM